MWVFALSFGAIALLLYVLEGEWLFWMLFAIFWAVMATRETIDSKELK